MKRQTKRVVRRGGMAARPNRPARPIKTGPTGHIKPFFYALTRPSRFKAYWFNRAGLVRLGKLAGIGLALLLVVFLWFAKDLPSPGKINARVSAQTSKFYDRSGSHLLWEVFGDKNRELVEFNQMPDNIKNATVAIEDKNFYHHGAFSFIGILRAAFVDLFHRGSGIQGGSTITQQYVKNALLSPERTYSRKIKELIISIEIEQLYKKDDILKLYLNEIPYGSQAYGIQAASKTYFGKPAKELTLDEATLLAAIPRAPTYYSPYGEHRDDLIARQSLILDQMVVQGYITTGQAEQAKKTNTLAKLTGRQSQYGNIEAPHFVLYVQEQLEAKYGTRVVTEGGLKITTTLDWDKQQIAQKAVHDNIGQITKLGGSNAAFVAGDPKTGQVLAMVGSYDFNDTKFGAYNVATADRQPGSSFKPFAYATAFSKNYGPGSTIYDVPTDFGGGYKPKNYTGRNYGVQSMRTALDGSLNIPAVKTLYLAGVSDTLDTAHKMGISTLKNSPSSYGLSLVLGSGEVKLVDMVNAYESFANGGVHYDSIAVMKVVDSKNNTLEEFKASKSGKKAIDPQVAYLIANILSDNNSRAFIFGTGSPLFISGRNVAAKTGTTENNVDAWTMGFTPNLVAGAWAGNNDNHPMTAQAASIAAPVWHQFMVEALKTQPNDPFVRPEGIKEVTLDTNTGKLATTSSKAKRTDLFPAWYKPTPATSDGKSAKVDKVSGKLATECTPPDAIETATSSEMHAEVPSTDPAYGRWEPPVAALAASLGYGSGGSLPTDSDNVHHCDDTKPQISLSVSPLGGSYRLTAQVASGTFTANKLDFYFDDQVISSQSISGSGNYSVDYSPSSGGSHVFKAKVTDAGLYSATDSKTTAVSNSGFRGVSPNSNQSPGVINFNWTSDPGASKYRLVVRKGGNVVYTSPFVTSTSNSVALNQTGAYNWNVEAYDGASNKIDTTAAVSFTIS